MTFLGLPQAPRGVGHLRGSEPFPAAARRALADSQLRANLGRATATIRAKRAAVVAEVPDWEQLRDAGAAIKARTMAGLDGYLEQLEAQVSARGGTVHWARDAIEANQIVTGLVRAAGATEAVKVKSLVTDEIGLNEALAAAGIQAFETDLAELIVQLGRDWPSHILVPAIHRNRAEIRQIFLREMDGVDPGLTDDPAALAEAARVYLRRKFLSARVGISGANFAVAQTGTLCVVESEGNGRMCLTLPDTLITVMGIEKLIPTWADLGVFLQLLPRSSTGERMNPYTSMWTGVTPGDGPQDFHLVLLDNGRTAALASAAGRSALHCIRCSACLNVCPVYERAGGHAYGSVYPGPIGAILSPQLTGVQDNASLPYASSLCGACYDVCPVKIDIPSILVDLRARHVEERRREHVLPGPEAVTMAAASWVMAGGARYPAAQRAAGAGCSGGRAASAACRRRCRRGRAPGTRRRRPPRASASGGPSARPARAAPARAGQAGAAPARGPGMSARDEVLARIRRANATAARDPATARDPAGQDPAGRDPAGQDPAGQTAPEPAAGRGLPAYRCHGDRTAAELMDLLAGRLADYRASVVRATAAELPGAIAAALRRRGARRMVVPAGLSLPGVPNVAELAAIVPDIETVADHGLTAGQLDGFDGAVTAAAVAIAETGTIVLDAAAPDQGRRAISLVPDYHLCVVRAGQVVELVPEAIAALAGAATLTWISGPSATSDIELARVEGVHGPRTLEVILVGD